MPLKLITAPTVEPITLAEAKAHLRITGNDDDTAIGVLITTARQTAEQITGRALMPQTWEKTLDAFPDNEIELPWPPLVSITSVKYIDIAGSQQTLASTEYTADNDSEPGWLLLAYGKDWPATQEVANAVRVRYLAGYADAASVPAAIKNWMLLKIGELYANREASAERPAVAHGFADHLLDRYTLLAV